MTATATDCWAVFRERAHSPGRESDDERILRRSAEELRNRGFTVSLKTPAEAALCLEDAPPYMLLMCERREIMHKLSAYAAAGNRVINTPEAILNTYRTRMLERLNRVAAPLPTSVVVTTAGGEWLDLPPPPVWVKRGDVHNTRAGDVVYAATVTAMTEALRELAGRGIEQAVVQSHIGGDLIKFYGIGDPRRESGAAHWFRWFYHQDQVLSHHPFDAAQLEQMTRGAAAALGLEIYGGDVIVTPRGDLLIIDVNAWPSFALFREEAARHIARHAAHRFAPRPNDADPHHRPEEKPASNNAKDTANV